jgi:hypothetical protein
MFGISALGLIEKVCLRATRTVGNAMQRAGRAHKLQDLVADPMHVDGERDAAKADERNA